MKKIISIILAVVLACSMMSLTAFADSLKGDINGDNKVSAVDARIILQYVAGLITPENTDSYDVNGDSKITAVDARIVLQIVAGLVEQPETPPQDDEKPEIPSTDEEKLEKFVELMNSVKTDASAATLVSTTMYECQEVEVNPLFIGFKQEIESSLADSYGTEEVNEIYTGEDIAAAFPPTGTTCGLTMNDIKSIEVKEGLTSYTYVVVVKGEKNPTRGKGVGAVATIITQEDLQAMIDENEELKGLVTMDAVYKDVTVKAEVDKETGKIIRYTADSPLIISTSMKNEDTQEELFLFSMGLGIIENWTITY